MNSSSEDRLIYYLSAVRATDLNTTAQLCREATEDPALFVFGELLHCPTISSLQNTPQESCYHLLRLFSYGTVEEYYSNKQQYPILNETQLKKLRMLTLITLAVGKSNLPYHHVLEKLHLTSTRQLEDIVIHAVYAGLIRARMDQRAGIVEITSAAGRDVVEPQGISEMITTLKSWVQRSTNLIEQIDDKVNYIAKATESAANHKKEADANVRAIRQSVLKGTEEANETKNVTIINDGSDVEFTAPMAGLLGQNWPEWSDDLETNESLNRSKCNS